MGSSTTSAVFTDPKATPATRSATARAKSVFGIASAGVVMVMVLSIFVGVTRRRKENENGEPELNGSFIKQIGDDTTIAGNTFIIDNNDSTYDSSISIRTSIENKESPVKSDIERHCVDSQNMSDVISGHRKPRTVAEIENLL